MAQIRASNDRNGSKKRLKKPFNADRYIAVSDLMAILSDLANEEQTPTSPQRPKVIKRSQSPLTSLPPEKSPTSPHLITPSSSHSLPTFPPSSLDRATWDVEATNVDATALSPAQPEEKTMEELARELWELKLVALSDNDYYNRQLGRLKNRFLWLAGLSVGTIVTLGIVLGWMGANLKQTQAQLANYEGGVTINRVRLDRLEGKTVESIEMALRSLETQIPETLETDLENTQEDITALKIQLREMELKLAAHDKALSVLVSALQGIVK